MVAPIAPEPGFDYASAAVLVPWASRDRALTELMQVGGPCCQQDRDEAQANAVAPHGAGAPGSGCLDRSCAFDLLQQRCQLALQVVWRSHRIPRLPLPGDLRQPDAVHEGLDVASVEHTDHTSSFDTPVTIPCKGDSG
jgi:hypothetical protein